MENEKAQRPSSLLGIQNRVGVVIKQKYSRDNEIGKEEVETIWNVTCNGTVAPYRFHTVNWITQSCR